MKKIKKWQIIILILLGVLGYWISNNTWVFEKKINQDQYFENLSKSTWFENEYRKWDFQNGKLKIWTPTDFSDSIYEGDWILDEDKVEFNGKALDNNREVYFKQKIYFMSDKTLILDPYLPAKGERHILKKSS